MLLAVLASVVIASCYDGDTCTTTAGEKIQLACIHTPDQQGPWQLPPGRWLSPRAGPECRCQRKNGAIVFAECWAKAAPGLHPRVEYWPAGFHILLERSLDHRDQS